MITVFGAEIARVWKLGTLPRSRQITSEEERRAKPIEAVMTLREGYAVSRTRENALFNMLASFTVAFGITRAITWTIREHGGIGPIKDVKVGNRHIHHFLPGGILALAAGGVAIGTKGEQLDKYLAFPFGVGVALVLDESALLLELDDVYWTEEGVLSVQIAFAAIALLSAFAYLIRMLRQPGKPGLRDRLGARRQGLGRPADELRRRARHRHLASRARHEVADDQLGGRRRALDEAEERPEVLGRGEARQVEAVEARPHRVVEDREAVARSPPAGR